MMITKRRTAPKDATHLFGTIPHIPLMIPGVNLMETRIPCSDYKNHVHQVFHSQTKHPMKKLFFFALMYLSVLCTSAQTANKTSNDTIIASAVLWEYRTIYVHNTHQNARQGEVEFKSHKDAETLNKYGREGWELVAVSPIIAEPMGNNRTYTQMLVYTFKRRLQARH